MRLLICQKQIMKHFKKAILWTIACLPLGMICLYWYQQSLLIQDIKKQAESKKVTTGNIVQRRTSNTIENIPISKGAKDLTISKKQSVMSDKDSSRLLNMTNLERTLLEYPPMQPAEEVEFPSTDAHEPLIPHKIHQLWCNESIPEPYRYFVETFITKNPKWQYRFWTYETGKKLLKDHYSYIVPTFDEFEKCDQTQFNMIKYAVLHKFGGVYADFDMENIRPLDRATFKYACIIPIKPYEQMIMYNLLKLVKYISLDSFKPYIKLTNDIMLCRPNHPFFQLLLSNLLPVVASPGVNHDQLSGVEYVTESYLVYNGLTPDSVKHRDTNHSSNTPNFNQGERKEDDLDAVYIPNSQYFYDNVDPQFLNRYGDLNKCWKFQDVKQMPQKMKHACAEFERRKIVRKNRKYTFVVHHNHQSEIYSYDHWSKVIDKVNINDVVPGCTFYK